MGDPPTIETIDGVGAEFLVWVRDNIVTQQERIARLEEQLSNAGKNERGMQVTVYLDVASCREHLRGAGVERVDTMLPEEVAYTVINFGVAALERVKEARKL